MNPLTTSELRTLSAIRDAADAAHANAARWPVLHDAAREAFTAAEAAFVATLDAPGAAALADAADTVRKTAAACAALEKIGGPSAIRHQVLHTPEAFAAFARGFKDRLAQLDGLKQAATNSLAAAVSAGIQSGALRMQGTLDPYALAQYPATREAQALIERIEGDWHAALGYFNHTEKAGVNCTPIAWNTLFACLAAPLPVVPSATPATA